MQDLLSQDSERQRVQDMLSRMLADLDMGRRYFSANSRANLRSHHGGVQLVERPSEYLFRVLPPIIQNLLHRYGPATARLQCQFHSTLRVGSIHFVSSVATG